VSHPLLEQHGHDLAAVRAVLARRRARHATVVEHLSAFEASFDAQIGAGKQLRRADVRCDEGGCRDALAKVFSVREGVLFIGRIAWLPSDQLTLRAWEHEQYLIETDLEQMDDQVLQRWLDQLDQWSQGLPSSGERWLKARSASRVLDDLAEPATADGWLPGLWVRCRRHPGHAEELDRASVVATTR